MRSSKTPQVTSCQHCYDTLIYQRVALLDRRVQVGSMVAVPLFSRHGTCIGVLQVPSYLTPMPSPVLAYPLCSHALSHTCISDSTPVHVIILRKLA
eukprot:3785256-Rhodomonas_salina.1